MLYVPNSTDSVSYTHLDVYKRQVGSYQIPVTVKLPKGFELLDDVVADVTISEVSNSDTNNE